MTPEAKKGTREKGRKEEFLKRREKYDSTKRESLLSNGTEREREWVCDDQVKEEKRGGKGITGWRQMNQLCKAKLTSTHTQK